MYEYLCYFVVYSFLGWCTEVAYAAVNSGKFVNRGFLNGPVCPIYGFGIIIVIACLTPLMYSKLLLFAGAVLLTSTLEWITGFTLEKIFHGKWWDYTKMPFNLNGYICLKFSILWGLACIIIVDIIHPAIQIVVSAIPLVIGNSFLAIILVIMSADVVGTVVTVNNLNKQLAHLNEISEKLRTVSNELGENIYESVTAIKEKSEMVKELSEELKEELEKKAEEFKNELIRTYDEEIGRRFFGQRRLMKAFPDFKAIKNGEHLARLKEKIHQS